MTPCPEPACPKIIFFFLPTFLSRDFSLSATILCLSQLSLLGAVEVAVGECLVEGGEGRLVVLPVDVGPGLCTKLIK